TRSVGRDFEQYAVGLSYVEAPEVVPIDLTAVRESVRAQTFGPGVIFFFVRRAEGNVMYACSTRTGGGEIRLHCHVQFSMRTTRTHFKDMHGILVVVRVRIIADSTHPHDLDDHCFGTGEFGDAHRNR